MRVLYIDIDTLRPDHLGCYGYHRNTSPNIDRIAAEGVRFDNCYASDAPCLPSRTALFSGRLGIHNGAVGHGDTAADVFIEGPGRRFTSTLNPQDPMWTVLREGGPYHTRVDLPKYLQRLRETGRAECAERLAAAHPEACKHQ